MAPQTQNQNPFGRQTVLLLLGIGVSAFVGAMIAMAFSDLFDPNGGGRNNTFSSSALGHLVAAEFLEDMGFMVTINRRGLTRPDQDADTVILAEPSITNLDPDEFDSLSSYSNVVLVLPKRAGVEHPFRPNWVLDAPLLPPSLPQGQALRFVEDIEIIRPEEEGTWTSDYFQGVQPSLPDTQLVTSPQLTPLLETDEGILIGAIRGADHQVIVISDPDLIANHGIAEGDNAAIFAQLIDMTAATQILWDETNHGFEISESIWRATLEPPLLAITLSVICTLIILLLATTYRFGSPLMAPAPFVQGKQTLVMTAAKLLANSRHYDSLMQRYLVAGLRRTAQRLNAPSGALNREALEWLGRLGKAKGMSPDRAATPLNIHDTLAQPGTSQETLIRLVKDYYDWKTEILDGPE